MDVVKDRMTLQYTEYIDYLKNVRKSSDNTLQAYVRDLKKFLDFASSSGISSFSDVTSNDVAEYKRHLNSVGLSPASVSRSLSALRSMYQYLVSRGEAEHNPAREIPNDGLEKRRRRY